LPKVVTAVTKPQASLRRPKRVAVEARHEPVQALREQEEERQLQEAAVAEGEQLQPERRASFALL
jgi:hypothetical protein